MGKIVLQRPDGSKFEVDGGSEEANVLQKAGYQQESREDLVNRATDEARQDYFSGTGESIKAGIGGLISGATLGVSDAMVRTGPDQQAAQLYQQRAEAHPDIRAGTELIGTLAAALPTGGESLGGRALAATPGNVVARIAEGAGGLAGTKLGARVIEGGVWGAAGAFQQSNVTGDPLTIEGLVEDAGMGAILNTAVGALSDKLLGVGKKAEGRISKAAANALDEDAVAKKAALYDNPPPSWDELREVHDVEQSSLKKANDKLEVAAEKFDKFKNEELNDRLKHDVPAAINEVRSYYAPPVAQNVAEAELAAGAEKAVPEELPLHVRNKQAQVAPQEPVKVTGVADDGTVSVSPGRKVSWNAEGRRVFEAPRITKQPMSEDTAAWIRGIEEQKSKALKLWAGGRDVEVSRWSKFDPNIAPDREAAVAELRDIKAKFEEKFAQASSHFKEIPNKPLAPTPFEHITVPKTLEDFGRMNDDQLRRFSAAVERSPRTAEAFDRLAADIGPIEGDTITDRVANLRGVLAEHVEAVSRLEKEAVKTGSKDRSALSWLRDKTGDATKYAVGREADRMVGYGAKGALLKSAIASAIGAAGGAMIGGAPGGLAGGAIGGMLVSGKAGVKMRIRDTLALKAGQVGGGLAKVPGVVGILGSRFPSGEKDSEKDTRKQAVNRINEVITASQHAPDTMFYAVQGLLGDASDVGYKIQQHVVQSLQYLAAAAPKDPGLDIAITGSKWLPSYQQVVEFAHTFEAVTDPLMAIVRALSGDGHPKAAQALWDRWGAIMQHTTEELMANASELKIPYERGTVFRDLFRTPITGLQQPVVVAALQGMYLPKPQPSGPGGSSSPTGGTPGRPPAVQSKVAGSSVAGLIS